MTSTSSSGTPNLCSTGKISFELVLPLESDDSSDMMPTIWSNLEASARIPCGNTKSSLKRAPPSPTKSVPAVETLNSSRLAEHVVLVAPTEENPQVHRDDDGPAIC